MGTRALAFRHRLLAAPAMRRLVLAAALALSLPALAESPRSGFFELRLGSYRPNIDAEFAGAATPYADSFGTGHSTVFQALFTRSLLVHSLGTVDLGLGAGYWEKYGHGVTAGGVPGDRTSMRVVPLTLAVNARVDWLAEQWSIPLAPYLRASLHDYLWWVYDGAGNVASAATFRGSGATLGYSFTAGVGLVLDLFDPQMAREMDRDTGINHTMLYVDATRAFVKGFGSRKSWDLSPSDDFMLGFGILFVF